MNHPILFVFSVVKKTKEFWKNPKSEVKHFKKVARQQRGSCVNTNK